MTEPTYDHKQLKALAKASRPWYAKKRFWLLGVIVLIIIISISNSGSSKNTNTKNNGGVSTLSNNGSNPPQADVTLTSCTVDSSGYPTAALKITNHSSGRSSYTISVNFVDDSNTKVAEGASFSSNVDPGQSALETAGGTAVVQGAVTCKVTNVDRFASH